MTTRLDEHFAGLVTVRPGRTLFVRKVRIGGEKQSLPSKTLQLVLVHGTCGTQEQYDRLLMSLSEQMKHSSNTNSYGLKLKCLLYDWMGCGQSPILRHQGDYAREETCQDLQALIATETDSTLPILFIGHSYGPNIFLNLSTPLPNVVGYVFLGSAARTPSLLHPDGGHPIFRLPLFILRCLQPSLNKAFVQQAVHPQNVEIMQLSSNECNHNDMFMAKAYHTQSRWTSTEQVVQVTRNKPCLVIHGQDDQILPIAAAQELANLVNAPLQDISVASHLLMMEQPDKVASILLEFIVEKCI
jgi:pimeloyl-ACP methyl ester carboxylesterase